jgi:hypothetical protein
MPSQGVTILADSTAIGRWLIKIGTAHEVLAARATEFAFLIVQLMAATRTPAPVFANRLAAFH